MRADWVLRKPVATDLAATRRLLDAEGLPTADLTYDHLVWLAESRAGGRELAGAIGLEAFAEIGLLRSLVVALEKLALERGIRELWLLTIDADRWFAQMEYDTMARENAPTDIRRTAEFSDLCPGDAVLMSKKLSV